MEILFDFETLRTEFIRIAALVIQYLASFGFIAQVATVAATGVVAILFGRRLQRLIVRMLPGRPGYPWRDRIAGILGVIAVSGFWFMLAWAALAIAQNNGWPAGILRIAVNLLGAWVVIRGASKIVRSPLISNALFVMAWGIAALNITGVLGPVLLELNKIGFNLGSQSVTGLTILKGLFALALLLWAAMALSRFLTERIRSLEQLTPTLQILFSKLVQFLLIALSVVLALQIVGIPLTAFAIFGGAIALGIGLGLQRAVGNVISGLMLLMDKSVKPGDVISVGTTFGAVTSLGGRYVGIRTRDGIEHLIPNEVFISNGIENWTYSDTAIRLKMPLRIAHGTDPRAAIALATGAANAVPRVLKAPPPECLLMGFEADGMALELRIWINDPINGTNNVRSEVYLAAYDAFRAAGIETPHAQLDLHVRDTVEIRSAQGVGVI